VNYWVQRGAERSKLVLGVPMYGRSFQLSQPGNNNLGAPASGPGNAGSYSQERGIIMYSEASSLLQLTSVMEFQFNAFLPQICRQQRTQGGWTVRWISEQQVPYTFNGDQWIGYEDMNSVKVKV
jgi:chitinase